MEKLLLKPIASAWIPPLSVLSQNAKFVQLYVWMCRMFQKNSSESHCCCLKPNTHFTFTERIFCSIWCFNVYNVWKKFFWKPFFCLKPTIQCTFTERMHCSIVCWNVYNVLKNFFRKLCFCLKPTAQCTFTERILCSIVCLNVYNVLKKFWKPLLLFEAHHSVYFHRAQTLINCMFACV